ncbi:prostaglandin G/H synthase 2-like [Oratosquilla oratoria]|uniref:prostaglandin G/H synthase 2-like n=1 Tax=Oratosquilla oratoria TaxID=337810 RepID=UPI003F76DACD
MLSLVPKLGDATMWSGRVIQGMTGFIVLTAVFFASGPRKDANFPVKTQPVTYDYNPCCASPCQNEGICFSLPSNNYTCDCTMTGFYGRHCDIPEWRTWLAVKLKPSPDTIHNLLTGYSWVWAVVNRIPFLQKAIMRYVYISRGDIVDQPIRYESMHEFITLDAHFNNSLYARTLPPLPEDCPTPMGIAGPKELPDVEILMEKVFLRREFIPEPHDTNLLFQYYAQHFTHQFFRTDFKRGPGITKGNGGVDVSNIYGFTEQERNALRSNVDGKLKTQIINGEEFPPYLKDVEGISMDYPPHVPIPEHGKFALGHPFFALLPGLFAYATIWVREHNRICDVLKSENPHWSDEQLYHTARLIVVGETIKITIETYVQHLSQYNFKLTFDPQLVHGTHFQFNNKIHAEFNHLYHWHPLVSDNVEVNGTNYKLMDMAYSTSAIFKHGLDEFIHALVNTRAGALSARNHNPVLFPVLKKVIEHGRELRFQGFNAYRKRFQMQPYTNFEDLTGDTEFAKILEDLYGDIDAVEFYVGLLAEKPSPSLTPLTMVNIGGPWSVKGLIANPICSPKWWKPSTFGGQVGFNIINTASLEKLFCLNMKTPCQNIKFTVPEGTP